ncbi:hypothetical protein DVH05_003220 [Phytophthora capsici]|nr:hypothetical protein DVH05_003220 [Phytophthora capsici]
MNLQLLAVTVFMAFAAGASAAVDHGKFEPFHQPEPATISEKAAIKFKPAMVSPLGFCVPLTAVNAAGEINSERIGVPIPPFQCEKKGGQVYGRAGWYKDLWAIMYSWYFPIASDFQSRPHDWHNVVVWIDNPAVKTPKIVGIAMSKSDTEYRKERQLYNKN